MIVSARQRALQVVNTTLIELYWQVGRIISHKIAQTEWGDGVVPKLAVMVLTWWPTRSSRFTISLMSTRLVFGLERLVGYASPCLPRLRSYDVTIVQLI
jgi:hypothetical protein